jgi:hypothetical protein
MVTFPFGGVGGGIGGNITLTDASGTLIGTIKSEMPDATCSIEMKVTAGSCLGRVGPSPSPAATPAATPAGTPAAKSGSMSNAVVSVASLAAMAAATGALLL